QASKSVSDLSTAASDIAHKASKSVSDLSVAASGAAKTASEHAFTFGAALSQASKRMVDGAKVAMDTAAAAKQSISETTTAIMEGATAAKAKITEVSKAASEKVASVSASVQENVKKAQEVSKAAMESAAPVVSAVASAASSVSDVAVNLTSTGGSPSDTNVSTASSGDIKETIKAATSSAASTALNKFSNFSKSLTSMFSGNNTNIGGGASTPRLEFNRDRVLNDSECVALADLCPMPAVAYKPKSPPNSDNSGGYNGKSAETVPKYNQGGENINVYECEIEQAYQQSTGTNSFESVVPLKTEEINRGPMVKHPNYGRAREFAPILLCGTQCASSRVEEWALRHLERTEL
ncbi:hypothetical protein PMAYCL1PPCAC_11752, partial [Pristionchus mayeri]